MMWTQRLTVAVAPTKIQTVQKLIKSFTTSILSDSVCLVSLQCFILTPSFPSSLFRLFLTECRNRSVTKHNRTVQEGGSPFSMQLSDWPPLSVLYMMINLAQVSPPRQQVRIDGIQEDYPSSWAGGTLSEFGKSVPNQSPAVLGGVCSVVWEALLEINGEHSRSMYC